MYIQVIHYSPHTVLHTFPRYIQVHCISSKCFIDTINIMSMTPHKGGGGSDWPLDMNLLYSSLINDNTYATDCEVECSWHGNLVF